VANFARQRGVYQNEGMPPLPDALQCTHEDIRLVSAVKAAQRLGFTLAETREIVRVTRRRGGSDPEGLREQVAAKLREV